MCFWKKGNALLLALLLLAISVDLTGCGFGSGQGLEPPAQTAEEENALSEQTIQKDDTPVVQMEGSQPLQGGEICGAALPSMRGEAQGSAVLEDRDFIFFYNGSEIRRISRESQETSVLWKSSHTDTIYLNGQAVLAGDKIFFIEHWWSMGYITEALSVINTDGTGYECIEEKEKNGGYLYFTDGTLYVKEDESVWVYEIDRDGTWKKIKTLTGNVERAVPEILKTGTVAIANDKFFLDIQKEDIYLTDRKTQESHYLAESSGRVIGMDEKYLYLCRRDADEDCIVYEKIAIEDGEKSVLFSQDDFSDHCSVYNIEIFSIMSQMAGDYLYYVEEMDCKLYLVRRSLNDPSEREVLGDAFFDSGISEVGRVEYYTAETFSQVNPDWGLVSVDLERLVVDESFPGAAEINRLLTEIQEKIILYEEKNFQYMEEDMEDFGERLADAAEKEGVNFRMRYAYISVLSPVYYYDGHYFSFYQDEEDYLGGAHGLMYRNGYTFDLLTGKRLILSDVIGNSEEELRDIVAEYFAAHINKYSQVYFWEDAIDTVKKQTSMESDFYLREEGICFYLPPYAVSSFAAGFQEVTIPYEEFEMKIPLENVVDSVQIKENAEPEPLFPPELVDALGYTFKGNGWKGVREWIEESSQLSETDGGQLDAREQPQGVDSMQSGAGEQHPETAARLSLEEVGMLGDEELFQYFPLINEYKDRMIYEYESYEAVSHLYQGPKELEFIYYLPERDRGKYALVYESGKSGGKRAYSVRLADLIDDVFVTVAEFDAQNDIGEVFLYKGEYYYIYGWKSGVSEEKGYDGFMLHKLSGNPKRETLLGQNMPDGEFVLTEREIFTAEKESDLFTPSERRVGQFGYIVYDNRWDFEDERNLPYADDWTFEKLREAYGELDLYGEFQQSDSETSVIYIGAFRKLVHNEVTFYDRESDKSYYLKDFEGVQLDIKEEGVYDPGRFEYYFFDADGNGFPELGILEEYPEGHSAFLYLFRYDVDTGQYSLWITLYPPYDRLLGTRKVLEYDGVHMKIDYGYYQLDQEGEVECKAYLYYLPIRMFEQLCLVMLPAHSDPDLDADVTLRMEKCGIYAREPGEWYFRVTEEQFEELETILMDAYKESKEKGEVVLYTYEELFGEG